MMGTPSSIPVVVLKYPVAPNCSDLLASLTTKYHARAMTIAYIALNDYIPIVFFPDVLQHGGLLCLSVDEPTVKEKFDEFNKVVNDLILGFGREIGLPQFLSAIMSNDVKAARSALEYVVERLRGLGLVQYASAFMAANEKAIAEMKRGRFEDARDAAAKAVSIITRAEYEYIVREVAKRYMVLWNDMYAIVLLDPPTTGFYNIPTDFIPLMEELARLFPDNVRVFKNPNDEDAAFIYAMRKVKGNKLYELHLLNAYLRLHGLSLDEMSTVARAIATKYPSLVPWVMKGLKSGYITYMDVVGDVVYLIEFPRNRQKYSGDFKEVFENALKLMMGLIPMPMEQ